MAKRKKSMQNVQEMMERGDELGDTLMGILMLVATNWKGMGIAAIGMAKALAALKNIALDSGVNIDKLYSGELAFHEREMAEMLASMNREM